MPCDQQANILLFSQRLLERLVASKVGSSTPVEQDPRPIDPASAQLSRVLNHKMNGMTNGIHYIDFQCFAQMMWVVPPFTLTVDDAMENPEPHEATKEVKEHGSPAPDPGQERKVGDWGMENAG